tara:strand:- start:43290 stop:43595 length:306 start_codon:yes stop_codon:yes gene_type:complete
LPGFPREQNIGEGMHISGNGLSLDVQIIEVQFSQGKIWLKFRYEEGDQFEDYTTRNWELYFENEDIAIGVTPGDAPKNGKIRLHWSAPEDYDLSPKLRYLT